jgi:hypothetical protein
MTTMKEALTVTVTVGLAILAVLGIFLASVLQDKRAWRQERQRLAEHLARLEQHVAGLSEATNLLAGQLAAARQAERSNAAASLNAAAAIEPEPNVATNLPRPSPYQVQVYLGQKSLGLAWAIPTNVRRDPKTGLVTCEPVISLPETVRGTLTTYVTNIIERQAPPAAPQIVEREYYVGRRPDWWWWPGWYQTAPDRPARPDYGRPQPSPQPPPRAGGPWTPVSVAPRPRPSPALYVPPQVGQPGIFVPPGLR